MGTRRRTASTVPAMSDPAITGSAVRTPGIPRRVKMSWKLTAVTATRNLTSIFTPNGAPTVTRFRDEVGSVSLIDIIVPRMNSSPICLNGKIVDELWSDNTSGRDGPE